MSQTPIQLDTRRIRYLSFDCYGTLIDWEQGILQALRTGFSDYRVVSEADVLLSFARWEAKMEAGPFESYRQVLTRVLEGMCREFNLPQVDPSLLADSVGSWLPFPDTRQALQQLQRKFELAILSNVDFRMFEATSRLLDIRFDHVCTSEEIQSYKPSPLNFQYLLKKLDCGPDEVLHVAQSLYHDHVPAIRLGIQSVWVNRPSRIPGQGATLPAEARPAFEVASMAELVQQLSAQS